MGSLKFTYQFRPLSRARCCILTKKNSLTTNPSVVQSEDSFSEGEEEEKDGIPKQSFKPHSEKYEGFTITKYTLIIEALAIDQDKDSSLSSSLKYRPILTDPNLTNKKTKVISRYFSKFNYFFKTLIVNSNFFQFQRIEIQPIIRRSRKQIVEKPKNFSRSNKKKLQKKVFYY